MIRYGSAILLAGGALALLLAALLALAVSLGAVAEVRVSGERAMDALLRVEALFSALKDAESGQRGYLLTGDETYLAPPQMMAARIEERLAAVEGIASNDARRQHVRAITELSHAWLEEARRAVALRQSGGLNAALPAVLAGEGRRIMRQLRAETLALQALIHREADAEQRGQGWRAMASAGLLFGAGVLAALLLGLLILLLRRRLAHREHSIEALLQERARTEFERMSSAVLLDALPVGVLLSDAAGRIVRSNAEAARIWGGPAPAVSGAEGGMPAEAWWLDSGVPLAPGDWAISRALRTGETSVSEMIRLRGLDGGERVIVKSAAPVRDGGGRLLGAVAIVQDVSEQQHEQDRRLEAEAQYRAIVETAADAIVTIDERGVVHSANPAVTRLFGHGAAEVVGRNVAILMPERIGSVHDGVIARYNATGTPHVAWSGREVTARHKDGSEFPVELSLARWRAGDGGWRFTGLMRDISERRRAERALQESDRRLRQLQVEFLHVARLTEIGLMSSTLAHELNQPLTAAASYLGGARRMLEAEDAQVPARIPALRDALARAAQQVVHAGQIVRRMRRFVAQEEAERCPEDLAALVGGAAELVTFPARQKNVAVRLALDAATPWVMVDRMQIRQVLVSLMHNAIEAMEGSPCRSLVVRIGPHAGDMAEIAVIDTGTGIAPEVADDLFLPFVTTKRSGLGVGLSVCRTIVEGHGGRIWAEPNPGGGTVFRITLPAAPPA
ncbi:PAS domain S-box protein [Roseomonas sp. E05]|uniref:PAS domain S-box protein n=1 Tax=Roseomonas sp. E05 TaxID=3046310 RepID=UPI0024B934DE|nr:PAS domain S-box protein [Roseomonas sp. E05]MDJ0390518.1 PAS domain S-box protein [Roseomonas sp. E05]